MKFIVLTCKKCGKRSPPIVYSTADELVSGAEKLGWLMKGEMHEDTGLILDSDTCGHCLMMLEKERVKERYGKERFGSFFNVHDYMES